MNNELGDVINLVKKHTLLINTLLSQYNIIILFLHSWIKLDTICLSTACNYDNNMAIYFESRLWLCLGY